MPRPYACMGEKPGRPASWRADVGGVQCGEGVVATAVELALLEIDGNIAEVDTGLYCMTAPAVGEVVLDLGLILDAIDGREGGLAEVGEAGDVDGRRGALRREADGVPGELDAELVDLVGADQVGVLTKDTQVVEGLDRGAREGVLANVLVGRGLLDASDVAGADIASEEKLLVVR